MDVNGSLTNIAKNKSGPKEKDQIHENTILGCRR